MVPHVHKVKVITDDEDSLGRWFKKDKPFPKEESSSVRNYMFNRLIPYLTDVDSSLHHICKVVSGNRVSGTNWKGKFNQGNRRMKCRYRDGVMEVPVHPPCDTISIS